MGFAFEMHMDTTSRCTTVLASDKGRPISLVGNALRGIKLVSRLAKLSRRDSLGSVSSSYSEKDVDRGRQTLRLYSAELAGI